MPTWFTATTSTKANQKSVEKRQRRARALKALQDGTMPLGAMLEQPPSEVCEMPAFSVLLKVRGMTPLRLSKLNAAAITAGVNLATPVGGLTKKERVWVVWHLNACRTVYPYKLRNGPPRVRRRRGEMVAPVG